MANECCFEIHAEGDESALQEFEYDLLMENPDGTPRERHMARIFDVYVTDKFTTESGTRVWIYQGSCAWSSLCCMTHIDKFCYGIAKDGSLHSWFIGLEEESSERNLKIEVHDNEPGMQFATRILAMPGEKIQYNEYDWTELFWEPADGEDMFETLVTEYNLNDAQQKELREQQIVIITDLDDDEWSI